MYFCIYIIWLGSIYYFPCSSVRDINIWKTLYMQFNSKIPSDLGIMKNPAVQEFDEDNQYKNSFCSNYCPNHTMCIYRRNPHGCPRNITSLGVSPITKLFIIRMHNAVRHLIANGEKTILSTASNMQSVKWHDQLSMFAQRWANQCVHIYKMSERDECRDMLQFGVKQMVYTKQSRKRGKRELYKWQKVITSWFDLGIRTILEIVTQDKLEKKSTKLRYGHLLNAAFQYVGCGYIEFRHNKVIREVYVCNYGPARYSIAKELYISGYPCSRCFHDQLCSNMYPSLCKDGTGGTHSSQHCLLFIFWLFIRIYYGIFYNMK